MDNPALFEMPDDKMLGGSIAEAAYKTIQALHAHGALDGTHALKVELIMQGAKALDYEFRKDKLSIAAMQLYTKVLDTADGLPTVQAAVDDSFNRLVDSLGGTAT